MTHMYAAEVLRAGEIAVFVGPKEEWGAQLAAGKAVQFYGSFSGLRTWCAAEFPGAEVWYTERNGDGIAMLVPQATDEETLPSWALDYMAFEWVDPDAGFGSGVAPLIRRSL